MAPNSSAGNGSQRRSSRKITASDKARDSLSQGKQIPGFDESLVSLPSQATSFIDTPLAKFNVPAPKVRHQHHPPPPPTLSAVVKLTIQTSVKMARTRKQDTTKKVAPESKTDPAFSANSFMLAGFPRPLPEDRDQLHERWYDRTDQATSADIIESYGDDGADDWDDFAGNPKLYSEPGALERAIGSAFINRAKHAYRANKTWAQFEADEEAINSMSAALREHDPQRHKILLRECLNNELRLHVFDKLKARICTEIFKEANDARSQAGDSGQVSAPTRAKKDSKVEFPDVIPNGDEKQTISREPDEYSIADWSGRAPVWYNGEERQRAPKA